jgi:alkylation response protein AidB-like acyl-CoA dehydrogenase
MSVLSPASRPVRPVSIDEDFERRLAAALTFCREHAEVADRDGVFPQAELETLAAAGALAAPLPERAGGRGLGTDAGRSGPLLNLLERIGSASLPVARLFEGHVNALQLIQLFGNVEQQSRCERDVQEGGLRFAIWNTDAEDGVLLEPDGDGYRLTGAKMLASGAGRIEPAGDRPSARWPAAAVPGGSRRRGLHGRRECLAGLRHARFGQLPHQLRACPDRSRRLDRRARRLLQAAMVHRRRGPLRRGTIWSSLCALRALPLAPPAQEPR